MSFPIQTLVINPAGEEKHTVGPLDAQVRLVNTDGTAFSAGSGAYELPEAGKDTLGGITQMNQTTGSFSEQYSFGAPTGDLWLRDDEKRILGINAQRAFSVDMATGETS